MTTLTAPSNMLAAYEDKIGQGAAKFLEAVRTYPKRVKPKRGRSTVPQVPLPDISLREPTPQRAEKAAGTRRAEGPPFNSQIVSPHQKFLKQLGGEAVAVLDRLVEMAEAANKLPRMTAKYDGITVDSSRAHALPFTDADLQRKQAFAKIWDQLGPHYQRTISELVFEIGIAGGQPRPYHEIGRELCGYASEQTGKGAAIAALRLLAWRVQELFDGKVPVRRMP